MNSILVALDGTPASLKVVKYVAEIIGHLPKTTVYLFHVVPMVSPNLLTSEEVRRIEKIHEEVEHLSGFFWSKESEEKMFQIFSEAVNLLKSQGIPEENIKTFFDVASDTIANLILRHARRLNCRTIAVGRRGLGRVKEILIGSTSSTVVRNAKGHTVWVVDTTEEE
ncbi:universal stress protein [Thermodesulforhabdus norvegica]|uniref:Nucleotide-binding universal stress protein, UspA family n=1 Tax=Thermodesulforhabdus norvegica TaxID=39841 RepID=A0A1I4R7W2_9BACT|nr:universal stress protein [Thermodesulforhabdus norvegica]SFM48040.1 Nucleotide-binding universal stress protein, UspA family [Thermodesulforhabdus norvegica]